MQNLLNKTNRFYKFLQTKYPCSMPIDLRVYKTTTWPDFTGEIRKYPNDTLMILVAQGKQTQKQTLFTLAHEYGHALQHDRKEVFNKGADGVDWKKEIEANFFAEKVTQEYKSWKGK